MVKTTGFKILDLLYKCNVDQDIRICELSEFDMNLATFTSKTKTQVVFQQKLLVGPTGKKVQQYQVNNAFGDAHGQNNKHIPRRHLFRKLNKKRCENIDETWFFPGYVTKWPKIKNNEENT